MPLDSFVSRQKVPLFWNPVVRNPEKRDVGMFWLFDFLYYLSNNNFLICVFPFDESLASRYKVPLFWNPVVRNPEKRDIGTLCPKCFLTYFIKSNFRICVFPSDVSLAKINAAGKFCAVELYGICPCIFFFIHQRRYFSADRIVNL